MSSLRCRPRDEALQLSGYLTRQLWDLLQGDLGIGEPAATQPRRDGRRELRRIDRSVRAEAHSDASLGLHHLVLDHMAMAAERGTNREGVDTNPARVREDVVGPAE